MGSHIRAWFDRPNRVSNWLLVQPSAKLPIGAGWETPVGWLGSTFWLGCAILPSLKFKWRGQLNNLMFLQSKIKEINCCGPIFQFSPFIWSMGHLAAIGYVAGTRKRQRN